MILDGVSIEPSVAAFAKKYFDRITANTSIGDVIDIEGMGSAFGYFVRSAADHFTYLDRHGVAVLYVPIGLADYSQLLPSMPGFLADAIWVAGIPRRMTADYSDAMTPSYVTHTPDKIRQDQSLWIIGAPIAVGGNYVEVTSPTPSLQELAANVPMPINPLQAIAVSQLAQGASPDQAAAALTTAPHNVDTSTANTIVQGALDYISQAAGNVQQAARAPGAAGALSSMPTWGWIAAGLVALKVLF